MRHSYNIISGINQNRNIRKVSFSYRYSADDSSTCLEKLKHNKSVTEMKIDFGPSLIIILPDITAFVTMNSSITCLSIHYVSEDDPKSYSVNFLKSLPPNLPLEELTLHGAMY